MQDEVKVSQADRDTAAELAKLAERAAFGGNDAASFRQGVWDNDTATMGKFLRRVVEHRHQAERDTLARMEPVGEATPLAGSGGGFTIAVFHASKVPVGTKLYALPPAPEAGQ